MMAHDDDEHWREQREQEWPEEERRKREQRERERGDRKQGLPGRPVRAGPLNTVEGATLAWFMEKGVAELVKSWFTGFMGPGPLSTGVLAPFVSGSLLGDPQNPATLALKNLAGVPPPVASWAGDTILPGGRDILPTGGGILPNVFGRPPTPRRPTPWEGGARQRRDERVSELVGARGDRRFLFFSDGVSDRGKFDVLSFHGVEGLSQLYGFELDLVSADQDLAFDQVVNKSALLVIRGGWLDRLVHGIVTRLDLVDVMARRAVYRAHLAPPHHRLTLRRRLRIFQDLTTQQIVTQVLSEGGVGQGLVWKLKETYKPRNYCVQYRESDMAFIARLLEEEGIAFHFEHAEKELRTVFTDHNAAFSAIVPPAQVLFNPDTSMVADQEFVSSFSFAQQLRSGKVYLRDFSFRQPQTPIDGVAQGREPRLEIYEFPGEFGDKALADRLARVRLEEQEVERQLGGGASDCNRLIPGASFVLGLGAPGTRYPRLDLNQEYLVLGVVHTGSQPQALGEEGQGGRGGGQLRYDNSFQVMPAKVPFRPPRHTPVPVALGTHTATVVGPKGEEIYVDEFGRVKVHFHWDREGKDDEHASCWIRVAQAWAGARFGGQFIPRIGQEVLVCFLEGDPDRPYINGRVYNAEQSVPHDLPAKKTISAIVSCSSSKPGPGRRGYNAVVIDDKRGKEMLFLHAERDMNVEVGHDSSESVGHDRTVKVAGNQTTSVGHRLTYAAEEVVIEASKTLTIGAGSSKMILEPNSIKMYGENIKVDGKEVASFSAPMLKLNS